ncbi:MAG TPA: oligopeptide/dipeptide ABC transporter ATP-binding protein [Ilumatobacteraceae bacterium]
MTNDETRSAPMLHVDHLSVEYPLRHGTVRAVTDVSFELAAGETLGLVGESGCGKSTTGKAIVQIVRPSAGRVLFDGVDLCALSGAELRRARTGIQMIFQDPISSLNPKHTVRDIVAEPLRVWNRGSKAERTATVAAMLEAVGLDPGVAMERRPHQFSGGQCQRISIARALVLEPKVLICDEPVSALDVSVQAQICNLLEDMKDRFGLTIVFIAHDLAVVRNVSDRVAVMYLGKLCEVARPTALYASPAHPYTDALLKSVPVPDPKVPPVRTGLVAGEPPSPIDPPSGCRFRTRCPRAESICAAEEPALRHVADGHQVACHFPLVPVELTKQDLQHAH